ncbi:MAG: hypothetical protein QQN44_06595 [Nitrosopumilus sp.]
MQRIKQTLFINDMKSKHRCYKVFISSLNSHVSQEGYSYRFQQFMRFCTTHGNTKNEFDYESLLELDTEQITDLLIDYVYQRQEDGIRCVRNYLEAPELFFEMNRKIWHKKVVNKSIKKEDRIIAGKTPATDDDVFNMIAVSKILRNKLIIHYLASTGSRPGSLIDPPLKFKHLIPLPDIRGLSKFDFDPDNDDSLDIYQYKSERYCYALRIYDESSEGYWAFLIPAASDILEAYREERELKGEKITNESYIFATYSKAHRVKYDFVTNENLNPSMQKTLKLAMINRDLITKTRYNKSQSYMFRKRFNGHLKLENDLNSNIAEKLMAHKRGLDGTYLQPTLGELYIEFYKAIPKLTPDPRKRHKLEILEKDNRIRIQEKILNTKISEMEKTINALSNHHRSANKVAISAEKKEKIIKILQENNIL